MHRALLTAIATCSFGVAAAQAGNPDSRSSRHIFRKKHNLRHE